MQYATILDTLLCANYRAGLMCIARKAMIVAADDSSRRQLLAIVLVLKVCRVVGSQG